MAEAINIKVKALLLYESHDDRQHLQYYELTRIVNSRRQVDADRWEIDLKLSYDWNQFSESRWKELHPRIEESA